MLDSPSQHESELVAEDGSDRCDGWTFVVAAEVDSALIRVCFVEAGIAAGYEQLEGGEREVGGVIAMAGGRWACHHLK